jgi:signal transduction histidine kinase
MDHQIIRADPSLLLQVLGNLLENAIKFSSEGSIVSVTSFRENGAQVLRVCDQGPGVADAHHARIFDRYYRLRADGPPGLGLGLYIVRSLTEMMGGKAMAGRRPDGEPGLCVTLRLPTVELSA